MKDQVKTENNASLAVNLQRWVRRFFPYKAHFALEYDKGYGVFKRTGWTVIIGYSIVCQLEKYLIWALVKSLWRYQSWELESKLNA